MRCGENRLRPGQSCRRHSQLCGRHGQKAEQYEKRSWPNYQQRLEMKKKTECFICRLPVETQEHRLCPACKCLEDLLPKSVRAFDHFVDRLIKYRVIERC